MRRLLSAACAVLASGCIRYVPAPIDVAASARAFQNRSLSDEGLRGAVHAAIWPPATWTLDQLTAAAVYFNADIAVARAEYATAVAAIATARERPNPTLNASLEHKATPDVSPWVTNLGFDLPFELPAKRTARVRQALALAAAAEARAASLAWSARTTIRSHLLADAIAARRAAVLRDEEAVERDIVEAFSKRVELGEAARPDLARARIALGQTSLLLRDVERVRAEERAGIAAAVGLPLSAMAGQQFDEAPLAVAAPDPALRDAALTRRADVVAALREYDVAEESLRLEVARQYPDVHLAPALGWDQGARTWTIGASAELPLFNRHRGAIGEALARRNEAAARLTALQANVVAAFDLASAQFDAARRKLADARELVRAETAIAATARRQFEAGEIDRLALRSAELELAAARLGEVDAEADLQRAAGAMEDVVQEPMPRENR